MALLQGKSINPPDIHTIFLKHTSKIWDCVLGSKISVSLLRWRWSSSLESLYYMRQGWNAFTPDLIDSDGICSAFSRLYCSATVSQPGELEAWWFVEKGSSCLSEARMNQPIIYWGQKLWVTFESGWTDAGSRWLLTSKMSARAT